MDVLILVLVVFQFLGNMDNGTKFLQSACRISIAYEQLLDFLINSDAPDDLIKDMAWFKIKFDKYRKDFFDKYVRVTDKNKES